MFALNLIITLFAFLTLVCVALLATEAVDPQIPCNGKYPGGRGFWSEVQRVYEN